MPDYTDAFRTALDEAKKTQPIVVPTDDPAQLAELRKLNEDNLALLDKLSDWLKMGAVKGSPVLYLHDLVVVDYRWCRKIILDFHEGQWQIHRTFDLFKYRTYSLDSVAGLGLLEAVSSQAIIQAVAKLVVQQNYQEPEFLTTQPAEES